MRGEGFLIPRLKRKPPHAVLKRVQPKAHGRGYPIKKPTCHITIVSDEISKAKKSFPNSDTNQYITAQMCVT